MSSSRTTKPAGKKKGRFVLSMAVVLLGSALLLNWYFTNNNIRETLQPLLSGETTTEASKNLGEAAYVGATTQGSAEPTSNPNESAYFSEARVERQKARDSASEEFNKVINSGTADADSKKTASDKLAALTDAITAENKIETLVKAKQVESCLAIINDTKVEIIVKVGELSDTLILQIKEIVMNQTKTSYENISIIESK